MAAEGMGRLTVELSLESSSPSTDSEQPVTPPWAQVLALPGTHLHLYGKRDAKRGRKMGHLNVTGATPEAALEMI